MSACLGLSCAPTTCRHPAPECQTEMERLAVALWGGPHPAHPLGVPYWIAKQRAGLAAGSGGEPAEESDEPQVVHVQSDRQ